MLFWEPGSRSFCDHEWPWLPSRKQNLMKRMFVVRSESRPRASGQPPSPGCRSDDGRGDLPWGSTNRLNSGMVVIGEVLSPSGFRDYLSKCLKTVKPSH